MCHNWKKFIINILIPVGVGALSGYLTKNSVGFYETLQKPALAPPAMLFPIVWTILFVLMGISAYLIVISGDANTCGAMALYGLQLFFNFMWPILFFQAQLPFVSFIWLVVLWILILAMILRFWKISKPAAILQISYLLWVTFAGYLNLAIFLCNR